MAKNPNPLADEIVKKYFSNERFCMAYENSFCKGDIIEAHTISEKYIKIIAENGHVYIPTYSSYQDNLIEFKLKGLNKVTRITGFCKEHDDKLFSSFEKKDFSSNYKQIYDISFRALCREYYQKKCFLRFSHRIFKGDLVHLNKTGYTQSDDFKKNLQHLEMEAGDHKFLYEQMKKLKSQGLSYLVITCSKLPLLTTGIFFPLINPQGHKVQSEHKKQLGFMYNILSLDDKSFIIISTTKLLHNNFHRDFFTSLISLNGKNLINYLLTYFFFNNDNVVINPGWFDKLDKEFKKKLNTLLNFQVGFYGEKTSYSFFLDFHKNIDFGKIQIYKSIV